MKKILVGFNGNEPSIDAVHLAADWAKRESAELHVLAVFDLEPTVVFPEEQKAFFEETFRLVGDAIDYPTHPRSAVGVSPAHALTELADREDMDMIVIGSTHHGPVGSVLAGTVATRLFGGAPCRVLIAPRGYARSGSSQMKYIGVGFDGSPDSWRAVKEAKALAENLEARVTLIAGYSVPYVPASTMDVAKTVREGVEDQVARAAEYLGSEIETTSTVKQTLASTLLVEESSRLDLLILGSRGYGPIRRVLLGGVSSSVVRRAYCPVLILPRGDDQEGPEDFLVGDAVPEAAGSVPAP